MLTLLRVSAAFSACPIIPLPVAATACHGCRPTSGAPLAGDGDGAALAMRRHIERSRERLLMAFGS